MHIKKVLVAAIMALILAASFPANAQQQSGRIAGLTTAQAAAAGLGLVVAGVLIANEIGSSSSGPLFPEEPGEEEPPPVDETEATETTAATATTGT